MSLTVVSVSVSLVRPRTFVKTYLIVIEQGSFLKLDVFDGQLIFD